MVEYTGVNLVTLLVGVGLLANGYQIVKRGREDVALLVLSTVVGMGLIVVAVLPGLFQTVATLLGLEWQARAILVVSNLTLFVIVIYLFDRIGRLYNRISKLNEALSLLKHTVETEGISRNRRTTDSNHDSGGAGAVQEYADD